MYSIITKIIYPINCILIIECYESYWREIGSDLWKKEKKKM